MGGQVETRDVSPFFVVLVNFPEWPENQILIPDWTYFHCPDAALRQGVPVEGEQEPRSGVPVEGEQEPQKSPTF